MTAAKHVVIVGDTATLNRILRMGPNRDPVDLANYTPKVEIQELDGTVVLAATATGITSQPTQTFTAATSGLCTCNGHGLIDGDQIQVSNSGGGLPTGLATSTRYFVIERTPDAFKLAATPSGASVVTTAGTGTHSLWAIGSLSYLIGAASLVAGKTYKLRFLLYSGSTRIQTLPDDDTWIQVEAKA